MPAYACRPDVSFACVMWLAEAIMTAQVRKRKRRVLTAGADCVGLNGMALAFEQLGVEVEVLFVSENNPSAQRLLEENFYFGELYTDVTARNHRGSPQVDVHTAGFPCVSYSTLGLRRGVHCAEGHVGLHCLCYVAERKPRCFLFENVSNLVSQRHWADFEMMLRNLRAIQEKRFDMSCVLGPMCVRQDDAGQPYYHIQYKVLNSLQYGVAQSRPRVYIVGIHRPVRDMWWPVQQGQVDLEETLDEWTPNEPLLPTSATELRNLLMCMEKLRSWGMDLWSSAIGDLGNGWSRTSEQAAVTLGHAPCLTRSRCSGNGYWIFSRQRRPTLAEYFRWQGIPPDRLIIPENVSENQVRAMIGNSFTVPVVAAILDRLLWAAGLIDAPCAFDEMEGEAADGYYC